MSYESVRLQSFPFHGFVFDNNSQCHSEQGLHEIKRFLKLATLAAVNYLILLTISREGCYNNLYNRNIQEDPRLEVYVQFSYKGFASQFETISLNSY